MSAKKFLLALLPVLLIILLLSILIHGSNPKSSGYTKVTSNLHNTWIQNDDIYFYSGSFFAKYDSASKQISRLSDYLVIKNGITSVSWSPDSVIFQSTPSEGDRDDLTTASISLGAEPYLTHWWRYNFSSHTYQLLSPEGADDCSSLIQASTDELVCLETTSSSAGSNRISLLNAQTGQKRAMYTTDNKLGDITVKDGKLYYVLTKLDDGQTLGALSLESGKKSTLYASESAQSIAYKVYSDGLVGIITNYNKNQTPEDNHEDNVEKSKQSVTFLRDGKILAKKSYNTLRLSLGEGGSPQTYLQDGTAYTLVGTGLEEQHYPVNDTLPINHKFLRLSSIIYVLGENGDLMVDRSSGYKSSHKSVEQFVAKTDNDPSGASFIDIPQDGNTNAYLFQTSQSAMSQQNTIDERLIALGFWPSEFNFDWIVDGQDYHTPLNPSVINIR